MAEPHRPADKSSGLGFFPTLYIGFRHIQNGFVSDFHKKIVIPAQAGIYGDLIAHHNLTFVDPCLRRDDALAHPPIDKSVFQNSEFLFYRFIIKISLNTGAI